MVRVSIDGHPLTATAALVWNGDLPRPLQQILFDTADGLTGQHRHPCLALADQQPAADMGGNVAMSDLPVKSRRLPLNEAYDAVRA
jgi:hypothetical protein